MSASGRIDLNADVGEGSPAEGELIPLVTSVNIACGAHAGDLRTMEAAVARARHHGVAIGAHPGFADREHFGRRELPVTADEAAALVIDQTRRLEALAPGEVGHVKLHGALYNMAARDPALAAAVAGAVAGLNRGRPRPLVLVALAGSVLLAAAAARGVPAAGEAFADRGYRADGQLAPRAAPGGLIEDQAVACRQVLRLAQEGVVVSLDGQVVPVAAATVCLHGDGPHAVSFARLIRRELAAAGIAVRALS